MRVSNETKVGALTAVAITILVIGYNFLKGNELFKQEKELHAIYNNVSGLSTSNHVQINGLQVGRVRNLQLVSQEKGKVMVTFNVDEEVKVPKNTVAEIISSDLLGEKAIQLKLGDSETLAQDGDTLQTARQPELTEQVSQQVLPVKLKAEELLSSLDSVVTIVKFLLNPETRDNIRKSLANVEEAVGNFTSTSYALDTLVQNEANRLGEIFANVESITSNLKESNEDVKHLVANLSDVSDSIKRANIKQTITNAQQALSDFSATIDKINRGEGSLGKLAHDEELYNNLNQSAESLDQLLKDLKANPERYVNFSLINVGGKKDKE